MFSSGRKPDSRCGDCPHFLNAVFAGHKPDIMNGFILAAVQCVASADRARLIRNDAHRALLCHGILRDRTALGAKAEREPLSELADNLGRLELELSFAVEAYLDVGLVLPDERLSAFERDLGAAMAIPEAAMACADMLSRLGAGVEASRVQVEKREREEDDLERRPVAERHRRAQPRRRPTKGRKRGRSQVRIGWLQPCAMRPAASRRIRPSLRGHGGQWPAQGPARESAGDRRRREVLRLWHLA